MSQYNDKGLASDLSLGGPSSRMTNITDAAATIGRPLFAACNNGPNINIRGAKHEVNSTGDAVSGNLANEIAGLEWYVRVLQGERDKIDFFRRELPICMGLLDDAIEASRTRLTKAVESSRSIACQASYSNYMNPNIVYMKGSVQDKASTSAEAGGRSHNNAWTSTCSRPHENENDDFTHEGTVQMAHNNIGMTDHNLFHPQYCKPPPSHLHLTNYTHSHDNNPNIYLNKLHQKEATVFNECNAELELMKQGAKTEAGLNRQLSYSGSKEEEQHVRGIRNEYMEGLMDEAYHHHHHHAVEEGGANSPTAMNISNLNNMSAGQTPRKARRCWAPELHQRFLHALHQLGGPQLATPKQIREVMHVEGLTNDEVKSHLQKFRLHTRRPAPLQVSEPAQQPHHLVLFGGIWVPRSPAESAPAAQLPACQLANSGHAKSLANHNAYMQFHHVMGQNHPMQTLVSATSSDELDVHAGLETASEVDVARSDQSTSQNGEGGGVDNNMHEEEDTEIHLGSKPVISREIREIASPVARARYQ